MLESSHHRQPVAARPARSRRASPRRESPGLSVGVQRERWHDSELLGQDIHRVESEIPFTALNACEVPRCHLELLCQLLLSEATGEANRTELLSECRLERPVRHYSTVATRSDQYQVVIASGSLAP